MTGKEFIIRMAHGESDIIQILLDILSKTGSRYCLIGGLAVNAYVEPVVSLDLDTMVKALQKMGRSGRNPVLDRTKKKNDKKLRRLA